MYAHSMHKVIIYACNASGMQLRMSCSTYVSILQTYCHSYPIMIWVIAPSASIFNTSLSNINLFLFLPILL